MSNINQAFGNKAVRGILLNPDPASLLALGFQLNPMEISIERKPKYEIDEIPGFDDPIVTWVSGGATFINFELFFDTTQGSLDAGLIKILSPLKGVLGIEAVLESFMRKKTNLMDALQGKESNQPPPDCLFLYGLRWFKCKLLGAPFKEILHNKLLVPQRLIVPIQLVVTEEGAFSKISKIKRATMALEESTLGLTSTLLSTII